MRQPRACSGLAQRHRRRLGNNSAGGDIRRLHAGGRLAAQAARAARRQLSAACARCEPADGGHARVLGARQQVGDAGSQRAPLTRQQRHAVRRVVRPTPPPQRDGTLYGSVLQSQPAPLPGSVRALVPLRKRRLRGCAMPQR